MFLSIKGCCARNKFAEYYETLEQHGKNCYPMRWTQTVPTLVSTPSATPAARGFKGVSVR